MKIGIDIDDTTVDLAGVMLKYADIFDTQVLGKSGCNGKFGSIPNRYYLEALYGWTEEEKTNFFKQYYKIVLEECKPFEHVAEVIQSWKKKGNEIFFITARLTDIPNCNSEKITQKMLIENHIPYDKLIMNAKNKLQFCQQNGIEIFIEDSYETCQVLEENGIKTFFMTTKLNETIENQKLERVTTWKQIEEKMKRF